MQLYVYTIIIISFIGFQYSSAADLLYVGKGNFVYLNQFNLILTFVKDVSWQYNIIPFPLVNTLLLLCSRSIL